jgi:hypothetical protein
MLRQFTARQIHQLVVVDIISEGFDLPAVEVASLARPTASLALYMQQFGRALRPAPGKDRALIIDHVGNFLRHGPPDRPRVWTLERRGRKGGGGDGIPLRVCLSCVSPYERFRTECPHCGTPAPPPASRGTPEAVEGDLAELDAETLARLRGAVEARDMSVEDYRVHALQTMPPVAVMANVKRHAEAQDAQTTLRASMTEWVRARLAEGMRDREVHRAFWLTFQVDVLTARALGRADAMALDARVKAAL